VVGSADMSVYLEKGNQPQWDAALKSNRKLAEDRSKKAIKYLETLNAAILAKAGAGASALSFSAKSTGDVHFFQDFSDQQIKDLKLADYGYQKGEGKANMTALVNYLQAASTTTPIQIGSTMYSFSKDEQKEAASGLKALLDSKAVVKDGEGYAASDLSKLNILFRRMPGAPSLAGAPGVKGGLIYEGKVPMGAKDKVVLPNVFARAIMQSTEISSRSVTLSTKVEAGLAVSIEKLEGGNATLSVNYSVSGTGISFNGNSGELHVFWATTAGYKELPATQGADGKFTVSGIPQEAQAGKLMAYAVTKDGKLNSGYVWQAVKAEVKQEMHNTTQTNGRPVAGRKNEYNTIPFYAVNTVTMPGKEPSREKVDARVAFEALGDKFQVLGFLSPGRNLISTETCYSADGKEIAIVRGITLNGTDYSKEDLLGKLNSRVIGIKVGDSVVALDGTTQLEMQDSWTEKDGLVYAPRAQQSAKKVVVREGLISGQRFGKARVFDKNFIPYYVVLPTKDVEFGKGGEKLPPRQIERLAKQGYTALVRMAGGEATVFDLNGNRLGLYSERDEPSAKVRGIYCYVPKEMQGDNKKAADKNALAEDRQYWFNYPQQVYGPSDAAYIQGIIRPVTRFSRRKVE